MKIKFTFLLGIMLLAAIACQAFPINGESQSEEPVVLQPEEPAAPAATPTNDSLSLPLVMGENPAQEQSEAQDLAEELRLRVVGELPPTPTPDADGLSFGGISDVAVLPLQTGEGGVQLWAVSSVGSRSYKPDQPHFVMIYAHSQAGWQQLSRIDLAYHENMMGVSQVMLPAGNASAVWLEATSVVGAHGGCYTLLYFDGQALNQALENCNSTPPAGRSEDINGDGLPEIVLDHTDYYVFCYACSVYRTEEIVWSWDGGHLVEMRLARLPRPADARLMELNDQAVYLAQADLWKEASEIIHQAVALDGTNPTVAANAALIDLQSKGRLEALGYSGYPLLSQVFYGDYAAAVDLMRVYTPQQIFSSPSPLITGTAAEGWDGSLASWLDDFSSRAMQAHYDRADIHFMHAWAAYLKDPSDPGIIYSLESAVEYAPDDEFYSRCLAYLKGQP
jgi:hypothetical protein